MLLAGNEANVERISNLLKEKEINFEIISDDEKTNCNCIIYDSNENAINSTSVGFESYDLNYL